MGRSLNRRNVPTKQGLLIVSLTLKRYSAYYRDATDSESFNHPLQSRWNCIICSTDRKSLDAHRITAYRGDLATFQEYYAE